MERENAVEWIQGQDIVTATFQNNRYQSKIRRLAEKFPDEDRIMEENQDGSILCQFPLRYLKINNPNRVMTEEQREAARERILNYHKSKEAGC